jgi:hypothetical protein
MSSRPYNPRDWYWDNGTDVFSSKTQTRVPYSDAEYQAWLARGNVATKDPGEAELREVLAVYEIGLTPAETAQFSAAHVDMQAVKAAYQNIIADLNTVIGWTPPLSAAQRDGAIQGLAGHLKTVLKGLRLWYLTTRP